MLLDDLVSGVVNAGVFIYTDRPFRIGDWIEWSGGSGSYVGIVYYIRRLRVSAYSSRFSFSGT
jgi:small conductance mechanosensitive channel